MLLLLLLSCFSPVRLCVTPQTAAHQAPPSLGFSRQDHWSGLPFPSPGVHHIDRPKFLMQDPIISVQFSSVAQPCPTLCNPMDQERQASLSITNSQSLLELMSIESMMPSNRLILSHPLLLLPSIFPSIRVFSNESVLPIRWPKYWSFNFRISPFSEYSGPISFRMNQLDLLAVQGTLKNLLQHDSSKPYILQSSAFFTVQLSHPYMTTGKTIA